MKAILPLLGFILCIQSIMAQTNAACNSNNVNGQLNAAGDLFWSPSSGTARFEVPKGSGKNTIYVGDLWIGGMDSLGQLHMAGQSYHQNGTDFFQGPVMQASNYSTANDALWNKVWRVCKSTVDSFRLGLCTGIPASVSGWPGDGNTSLGEAQHLAPYIDFNHNGIYDPANGDYPLIRGDEAVYFIYNDDRGPHGETGGTKLGIEIHGMAYAFKNSSDSALNYTVFTNYQIFNRSGHTYHNVFLGNWTDTDIGYYGDDYIGCDVGRSAYYGYNGLRCDQTGGPGTYGCGPPAQGVVLLQGPLADPGDGIDNNHNGVIDEPGETWVMSKFMYYNNDFDTTSGNPSTALQYYHYMQGIWRNNTHLTYGGNGIGPGVNCDYVYPGASDPAGWGTNHVTHPAWSETTAGNAPGDRRGLGSFGPFTLGGGAVTCIDFAYTWARDTGNLTSVSKLQTYIDTVRNYFINHQLDQCYAVGPNGIEEHSAETDFILYPNPCDAQLSIRFDSGLESFKAEIFDMAGKQLLFLDHLNAGDHTFDVSSLARGIYFLRVISDKGVGVWKFIKH